MFGQDAVKVGQLWGIVNPHRNFPEYKGHAVVVVRQHDQWQDVWIVFFPLRSDFFEMPEKAFINDCRLLKI